MKQPIFGIGSCTYLALNFVIFELKWIIGGDAVLSFAPFTSWAVFLAAAQSRRATATFLNWDKDGVVVKIL